MKKALLITIPIFIILALTAIIYFDKQQTKNLTLNVPAKVEEPSEVSGNMKLTSPTFEHNEMIPAKYTCDGDNVSPPLEINEVSERARSLILIVDDPDALGKTWVHWTVWNIPVSTKEILEGAVPEKASEGITDFGKSGYGGPCPPSGTHRYFFKLYAIGTELYLDSSATKEDIEKAMESMIIEKAELIGLYQRQ